MNEITIDDLLNNLENVKTNIKETINSKKIESIGDSDFITEDTKFSEYSFQIEDKLTRKLPTIDISVKVDNNSSVMGTVNINGLGKTVKKTFNYNDICTINAIPKDTIYEFVSWDDGNTDSCRTINIKDLYNLGIKEKEYIAIFQEVIIPDEPEEPGTPVEPGKEWYFWNGSDSDLNSGKELSFTTIKRTQLIYGEKEDILRNLIIITPKGVSISVKLRNALMLDEKIDLDILNPDKETFKKLPSKFISEETVNNYDFTGTSFNEDKLDNNSNLIMTYIEK